jgi:FkbM family methyltransferase
VIENQIEYIMLFDLHEIIKKYNIKMTGILHVGAHHCEELPKYEQYLPRNAIVWIDALPEKVGWCRANYPNLQIIEAAVSDSESKVTFHRANNGESSSFLEFGSHLKHHPHIYYVDSFETTTRRIDDLLDSNYPNFKFNFINLDIQGVELLALKGMEKRLASVDYIYTEVNCEEVYKGCTNINDLNDYLTERGFKLVDSAITEYGWGDAIFVRGSHLDTV